jgi:hypothetical protein
VPDGTKRGGVIVSEHIRTWEQAGFRVELFDTYGKSALGYEFYDNGALIFEGEDFHASPLHAIDGDETVGGLLAFLSLRSGDTDPEWFEGYTPEQMAWVESGRAEELGYLQSELEEGAGAR